MIESCLNCCRMFCGKDNLFTTFHDMAKLYVVATNQKVQMSSSPSILNSSLYSMFTVIIVH